MTTLRRFNHLETHHAGAAGSAISIDQVYFAATMLPRLLVQFAGVAALAGFLSSCVPEKQYREAESAANAQAEARARDHKKLVEAENRMTALSVQLEKKEQELASERSNVSNSKLETTVAQKDREAAGQLVTQLQSDLARAGDHLAWFSSEKRDLGKALLLAEQRTDAVERASKQLEELVGVSRDLSLLLGAEQSMGDLSLGSVDGVVVLGVPETRLFAVNSEALIVDAAPALAGIAKAETQHSPLKLVIRAPGSSKLDAMRGGRLVEALVERGVARDHVAFEGEMPPAEAAKADASKVAPATDATAEAPEATPKETPSAEALPAAPTEAAPAPVAAQPASSGPAIFSFRFTP